MRITIIMVMLSLITVFSSCATIVDPGPDKLSVSSNPDGANLLYNGEKVGTTPMEIELDRSKAAVLTFEKEGFYPVSIIPSKVINGWALAGGIFILVDVVLENANKYSTKPLNVKLTPKQ